MHVPIIYGPYAIVMSMRASCEHHDQRDSKRDKFHEWEMARIAMGARRSDEVPGNCNEQEQPGRGF